MAEELRVLVSGEVQGVGFRWTVQRHAEKLSLNGWVHNLADGRVEICVQGDRPLLEQFLILLQQSPGSAKIGSIDCTYSPLSQPLTDFGIRF